MKILVFILMIFSVSQAFPATSPKACLTFKKAVASGSSTKRLAAFIKTQWNYNMETYPEWASYVGYPGQDDRWTDRSLSAIQAEKSVNLCQLAALSKINRQQLKGEDVINFDLLKSQAELSVEGDKFAGEYLAIDHLQGLQLDIADIMEQAPKSTRKNFEDRLVRLSKVPQLEQQIEGLLREGRKRGVMGIKMFLERVPTQFDRVLTLKVEDSPLYKAFATTEAPLSSQEKTDIQKRALKVITEDVYPSLKKLKTYLITEYIPNARTKVGWEEMPDGAAWYAYLVKVQTTTNKTPDELHKLGLSEVARITAEMDKVRQQVKFKGDLKSFNKFLLTDKQFYFKNKQDLLVAYRDFAKRVDPELIRFFKTLPRMPYGVREMPEYKAKEAPAAYYEGGSLEGARAGYFTANTHDLPSRPKWGIEALTLHEAVPGHHLQISLAQELTNLPEFRRHGGYTAFIEGWGLYAEGLGAEMGFYKDPYSKYGQLSMEMLRACRLVLDTGLHSKGWTRDQAVQYFLDHNAMTKYESEVEVDRYLTWPGQALAYKVGELKIRELRAAASKALGDKFDLRQFHDEVLKHGALPLDVLEKSIQDWTKAELRKKTKV